MRISSPFRLSSRSLVLARHNRLLREVLSVRREGREVGQGELLNGLRRAVSEILNKPFTERMDHRVFKPDQRVLALWAAECAARTLPFFEAGHPEDGRPRRAIEALQEWIRTGVFSMAAIRKASLDAHSAAKAARTDDSARFAAHAAGQAVATAHVPTHALGSSMYAIRAVAAHSGRAYDGVVERTWQLRRLRELSRARRGRGWAVAPGVWPAATWVVERSDSPKGEEELSPFHGRR